MSDTADVSSVSLCHDDIIASTTIISPSYNLSTNTCTCMCVYAYIRTYMYILYTYYIGIYTYTPSPRSMFVHV